MQSYSEFIVDAMSYVDEKILQIDSRSIDRQRLHNKINAQIVANVKKLVELNHEVAYIKIDDIFKEQLNDEIVRHL